jgi:hypothetical protein
MEIQEIEVVIEKDGQVRLEVRGAPGTQCLELTKDLEAALGGQILSREMTSEAAVFQHGQIQAQQRTWSNSISGPPQQ